MSVTRLAFVSATALASFTLAACATVEEAVVEKTSKTYNATLTGAQVPGGGDPDYAFVANRLQLELSRAWKRADLQVTAQHVGFVGVPHVTVQHHHAKITGRHSITDQRPLRHQNVQVSEEGRVRAR